MQAVLLFGTQELSLTERRFFPKYKNIWEQEFELRATSDESVGANNRDKNL
jgi:hypothetical protein